MPLERVSHLHVEGNVNLHSVSGVLNAGAHHVHNPVSRRWPTSPPALHPDRPSENMGGFFQPVPHLRPIEGGVYAGKLLRIRGRVNFSGGRFEINLQNGPQTVPQADAALHVSVRPTEGFIALNSLRNNNWESETRHGASMHPGQPYEILILCDHDHFKVSNTVREVEYSTFHRQAERRDARHSNLS